MTWHVHIEGQVQGVGFRPFVYNLANTMHIYGQVNNTLDGVHVLFNAERDKAHQFYVRLQNEAPYLSVITASSLQQIEPTIFSEFSIVHSDNKGESKLLVSPDFALCSDCRKEMSDKSNRRFNYAFTSCTHCGPRFSIINQLPYDRENTNLKDYIMCGSCQAEYDIPNNRRYYSQINSCPDCGIGFGLYNRDKSLVSTHIDKICEQVSHLLGDGKIVAIKGTGGYLLACDASNIEAIQNLRDKKHRPDKPFALMYPSDSGFQQFNISEREHQLLNSPVAPIVLLDVTERNEAFDHIAPGLNQIGVMIPSTPLFEILLSNYGKPIVATSGNVSSRPIIYNNDKAIESLSEIADVVLIHDLELLIPQDDSVVRFSKDKEKQIVIRRSRGMAPTYLKGETISDHNSILSMGAMLKSTFCLQHSAEYFVSQYLGDLTDYETQQNYNHTINHFLSIFNTQPEIIIRDKHPDYASSQYGDILARSLGIPIFEVQHHLAHFSAILGEHQLVDFPENILGVIWDGVGLGDDNQIWGGEFFIYNNYTFERASHFKYWDYLLGDKMAKEPRLSALAICRHIEGAEKLLRPKFNDQEWKNYNRILESRNHIQTSSIGRLFDAVSSLIELADISSYEGEGAMKLEALAQNYFCMHGLDFDSSYFHKDDIQNEVPTQNLITSLISDLNLGIEPSFVAAKFHYSLVKLIEYKAESLGIKHLCLSGGVFQNAVLVDLILHHLEDSFQLYFHEQLSPNDENISFGQVIHFHIEQKRNKIKNKKTEDYVFSNSW